MYDMKYIIAQCLEKLGLQKETDLCSYLPDADGYRMHHKTYNKLVHYRTAYLADMLKDYILSPETPKPFPPKKRTQKTNISGKIPKDTSDLLDLAIDRRDDKLFHMIYKKLPFKLIKSYLLPYIKENQDDGNIENFVFTVMKKKRFIFRLPYEAINSL